jgi:bifunctional non-homologous end joining protein LigD
LAVPTSPFADPVPKRGGLYVKPELVVQIEYRRKGEGGILQQAAFKGIRSDKSARDVIVEQQG